MVYILVEILWYCITMLALILSAWAAFGDHRYWVRMVLFLSSAAVLSVSFRMISMIDQMRRLR